MSSVGLRVLTVVAVALAAFSLIGSPRLSVAAAPGEPQTQSQAQPSSDQAAGLSVPPGATSELVSQGFHLFHGEAGGGPCYTCHGADAKGTALAPNLTANKWLWSDGSWPGITKTITEGVPHPKQHVSPMPPMGGAQLTPEQVSALGAYVWALSHH